MGSSMFPLGLCLGGCVASGGSRALSQWPSAGWMLLLPVWAGQASRPFCTMFWPMCLVLYACPGHCAPGHSCFLGGCLCMKGAHSWLHPSLISCSRDGCQLLAAPSASSRVLGASDPELIASIQSFSLVWCVGVWWMELYRTVGLLSLDTCINKW